MPDIHTVAAPKVPPFPKPEKSWRDALGGKYKLADLSLANGLVDATLPSPDRDWSIKGWFVYGTNLTQTLPDRQRTLKAIQSLDLMVVIDTMPMEITGWADVILPECTYLERYDSIRDTQNREASIALRVPAAKPLFDSKPAYWMAKELAKHLDLSQYFPFENLEDELESELKAMGSSLKEMKKVGVKVFKRETDDLYFQEGQEIKFETNSGKIELYSSALAAEGFDPMPKYTPHPEPPQGFYRLIYGRAPMHTFSRTVNNPNLSSLMSENALWVNPITAKEQGLEAGQEIYLENQDGVISTFPVKVRITERIRWDSVYMVHGFGNSNKELTRAHGRGASDSQLITNVMVDPVMGGTGMRGNFIKFRLTNEKEAKS